MGFQFDTGFRQSVEMGHPIPAAVPRDIAVAEVIRHDYHDIRPLGSRKRRWHNERDCQGTQE
jgi:hypothetical protein